jgi:membrane protease YdiL (CAAX protease family)
MRDDTSVAEGLTPLGTRLHQPMRSHIFFGPDGLRAGWRALLFVVIVVTLSVLANLTLQFLLHVPPFDGKQPLSPWIGMLSEGANAILVLTATWIMARIEGRSLLVYGYAGRARLARFLWGGVWGFVALSSLVAVLWKSNYLAFGGRLLHGAAAWEYGLAWLLMFLLAGIFEESLLRGYLQYTLTRGLGFWWGALLMSILFGAIHGTNKGESPIGLFSAAAVGLVFCLSLWYTGSLWWAIGFHATWDWAQSFFYGTPDSGMVTRGHLLAEHPVGPLLWSGGPTGPEGSLYILPLLLIMAAAMWLWWGRCGAPARRNPYIEDQPS